MANDYLSYTSRDFNSIRDDLINSISSLTNVWTSREQSDPGMVLVTLMAALGDNLSFNMDKQSLEFFGKTVTQRKNAKFLFDLLGYKMHWYKSAQVELNITNLSETDSINLLFNPTNKFNTQRISSSYSDSVPPYFILNPNESISTWDLDYTQIIGPGETRSYIAIQGYLNSLKFSSSAIDSNNRYYLPVNNIDQNHMWLSTEQRAYQWYLTDNINEVSDSTPRFEFDVDEYNMPYIQFVSNWRDFGLKDTTETTFTLYYIYTAGASGDVSKNVLDYISNLTSSNSQSSGKIYENLSITHGTNAYYTDNLLNIPGKDPETAAHAYLESRNVIGTYNTLVTLKDFERFFNSLGIISNSLAIDGQKALDLNESIANTFNYVLMESDELEFVTSLPITDINENKIYVLIIDTTEYISGSYQYIDNEWKKIDDMDSVGFKPYTLQMHLVVGNFAEKDPEDSELLYATSTKQLGLDSTQEENRGWMKYTPTDVVVGEQSSSIVNQSSLDEHKLISADVSYGSVRKFPFYIDGKIHLKEKMSAADASKVLQNIYVSIYLRYIAQNLTFGQKIGFANMISTIINSDPNIDYFDAGANNSNGSLFIYPSEDNLNPYDIDDNGNPRPYGINIDAKYFNPCSLQHFEDILYTNNKYMYWCETASGHLSIDADSIAGKTTPVLNDISANISKTSDTQNLYTYTVNLNDLQGGMLDLFEYAFVSELETIGNGTVTIVGGPIYYNWQDASSIYEGSLPVDFIRDRTDNHRCTLWTIYEDSELSNPHVDQNHVFIAFRMKETLSTETSVPQIIGTNISITSDDNN